MFCSSLFQTSGWFESNTKMNAWVFEAIKTSRKGEQVGGYELGEMLWLLVVAVLLSDVFLNCSNNCF